MSLAELRTKIDEVDQHLIQILAERHAIVREIGALKKNDTEIVAQNRQQEIYQTRRDWAQEQGLNPDLVEHLFRTIINFNIEMEREQLKAKKHES